MIQPCLHLCDGRRSLKCSSRLVTKDRVSPIKKDDRQAEGPVGKLRWS